MRLVNYCIYLRESLMNTNDIVFEIGCVLKKNPNIGSSWIAEEYQVTMYCANGLLKRAQTDLMYNPQKYLAINENWEATTIVPEHHKFTPRNLYREFEPETFIITKQSKMNYD